MADCDNSKLKFEWFFIDIFEDCANFDFLIVVDEYTSHESSCLLIDIDPDISDWSILIEGFFDILVCKITIDILNIEAIVLF